MATDIKVVISTSAERAAAELRNFQRTGTEVTSVLARDFEQLGIRSTMAIDKERAAAVAAFDKIKSSGVASYDDLGRASQALNAKLTILDKERALQGMGANLKSATTESRGLETTLGGVNNILGAMGVTLGAGGITALYQSARQARIEMDAIHNSLAAGTQSRLLAGEEFDYVAKRANYLGLNLQRTATDYAQIVAAAKGTSLEGEKTRQIFDGVTTASTALHLSADKTSSILRALTQMMSKGTVQTEELKGQLGEALPGAYQMAAKAMGLTTAELAKQLEKGQIMASDMLPKLAEEMEKRFGKQIPEAVKSTQAELNRLENTLFNLKLNLVDSGIFSSTARGMSSLASGAQSSIMYMSQAKTYWGAMVDKAKAVYDAGGLIGMLKGGKAAQDELKAQFAAIDAMADFSRDKAAERAGLKNPIIDPALAKEKRQQELDAKAAAERDAAEKAKQEAEKLMKHELDAFKAHLDSKTALSREQKAIELADLKGRYDQGLVATRDYYEKEKQIALAAAQQELENTKAYLAKETALLANLKGRSKKGEKDPEYVEQLAKHEKAIEGVTMAEYKLQKATIDEGNKITSALRQREEAYRAQELAALDAAGQYTAAEEARQAGDRAGIEYLRLKAEALSGVETATKALASWERKRSTDLVSAQVKESESARQQVEEISKMRDEVEKLNGADQDRIKLTTDLREGISKETQLRDKLRIAIITNNQLEISGLNSKIELQSILNQRLQQDIALSERKKVLSGEIVGFNNGAPIYADSYSKQQAATGYVSNSQLSAVGSGTQVNTGNNSGAASPYVNINAPFWNNFPSFDVGTPYVPRDMIAKIHQGERIVPAAQNRGGGGATTISIGDIIVQGGSTGAETAREIARAIYPELQKLSARRLAA